MPKKRGRFLTLAPETISILEKIGNASGYVDKVVLDRSRQWQEDLALLAARALKGPEVEAMCQALGGYAGQAAGVAPELERASVGAEAVKAVASDPALASAVLNVSKEFWFGNEWCQAAIGRMGS